jgi:hypothetical protein
VLVLFVLYAANHPIDFGVYHAAARAMLDGHTNLYGPGSGEGWPMNYRYAPVFLLLMVPLALLPLPGAAGLWVAGKLAGLYLLIPVVRKLLASAQPREVHRIGWLIPFLICASYLTKEFRSGNVHFFTLAVMILGLYLLAHRPWLAGFCLALATTIKLFPAFFFPYLLVRGYRRWVTPFAVWTAALLFLPALYFGFDRNNLLLAQWARENVSWDVHLAWGLNPEHSLRGVMLRYLAPVDYSQRNDPNYLDISFAQVSPETLHAIWLALAAVAFAGLLVLADRMRRAAARVRPGGTGAETLPLELSLLFCAMLLLEPHTQRFYLVALIFPALVLASEFPRLSAEVPQHRVARYLAVAGMAMIAIPPAVQGSVYQRLFAVYSPDFWGTLLLTMSLALLLRIRYRASSTDAGGAA